MVLDEVLEIFAWLNFTSRD